MTSRSLLPSAIRLSEFPSVQSLEDRLLTERWRVSTLPLWAYDILDAVTREVFHNTLSDTLYQPTGNRDLDAFAEEDHESQFETDVLSDDQVTVYFLPRGLDFRDDRGHPLRCTIFIARQAEAACKGIAGRLPMRDELAQKRWEEDLEREAAGFLRSKGRQSR